MAAGYEGVSSLRRRLDLRAPFGELTVMWVKIAVVLTVFGFYGATRGGYTTEAHFFFGQDLPVLLLNVAVIAALGLVPLPAAARLASTRHWPATPWVFGLAALCVCAGVLGAGLLFQGYTLSLDEFLANFDAKIFAHGQVFAPIDPVWRPFVPALQPMYLLPVPDNDVWASAYLPVNAALRALGRIAHAEDLVNPLLSAFSILAAYGVGRRLWPERRAIALVAAALLGTSAQLIVMSMTAYAMPAHLAFNLAWLWLFLRGGRLGHAGAIVVGFFAAGIHQLLFHPLFAAPFVLQLWLDRRWRLAAVYTVAYALICGFWIEIGPIEMRLLGESADNAGSVGQGWFLERVHDLLSAARFYNLGLMGEALMRYVTWQNPLVAPLAAAGSLAAARAKGHLRALLLGVVLTLLAMLVVEPTQTHGWGYRYLHGLLGSICLIGAWTWTKLTDGLPLSRSASARAGLIAACAVSLLVITPLRAWQAWSYVRPYAAANAKVQSAPAQVVIIDHEGAQGFDPGTIVRNDPFLKTGPKVMELSYMDADMVRQVCAHDTVRVFTGANAAQAGIDTMRLSPEPQVVRLRALMRTLNCGQPIR